MTESRNRDLATSIGAAVAADNIATDGSLAISGVTTYTNLSDLPSTGVNAGDLGFVTANNGLYIRGTSGWYVIALVNTSPTYTTSPASSYDLAKDGSTTTVITIVATDPEGFTITYSAIADTNFNGLAAVSQGTGNNTNVFTVTPKAQGVATTESGTLTFRATDGVNNTDVISTFTLTFITNVEDSKHTLLLFKATGNNKQNTLVDGSTTGDTVNLNGNPRPSAFTPFHPMGYSRYFPYDNYGLVVTNDNSFTPTNKNFTIEAWIMLTGSQATNATIFSRGDSTSNREFALYLNDDTLGFKIWNSSNTEKSCTYTYTNLWVHNQWYHVAASLSGSVGSRTMNIYIDGKRVATTSGVDASYVRDTNSSGRIGDANWESSAAFKGYMRDLRLSFDSSSSGQTPRYSGEFITVPTEPLTNDSNTQLLFFNGEGRPLDKSGNNLRAAMRIQNTSTSTSSSYFVIKSPYDALAYDPSTHGTSWQNFDGANYANISHNSSVHEINTSDFTIEGWMYTDRFATGYAVMFSKWSAGGWLLGYKASGPFGYISPNSGGPYTVGDGSGEGASAEIIEPGQWNHIAFTYDNSTTTLKTFVNGYVATTETTGVPATVRNTATPLYIGSYGSGSGTYDHHGMLSDLRLTVGSIRYSGAFTPPTAPLSNDSNTRVFVNSDLGIYNEKGASPDDDNRTNGIIINGDAKSSTTQTKNASSSMYFDGSSDYVEFDDSLNFKSDDLTIEAWVYPETTNRSYPTWLGTVAGWGSVAASGFRFDNTGYAGKFGFYWYGQGGHSGGNPFMVSTNTFNHDAWYHVAFTRHGGNTWNMYVNGVLEDTETKTTEYDLSINGSAVRIGNQGWDGVNGDFKGYVEDLRITKGIARYPFRPPKETLTNITNTVLLACHTNTITTDGSGNHTLTSHGDVAVSNYAPFTNGKSIYFDGTGDYISIPTSTDWDINTTNYTFEAWINIAAGDTSYNTIFSTHEPNSPYYGWEVDVTNSGQLGYWTKGTGGQADYLTNGFGPALNDGQWHHVAVTWSSSTIKLFVDGNSVYTTSSAPLDNTAQDTTVYIGRDGNTTASRPFGGYISNLRIVKGSLVYTDSFTPPTAELEG